MFQAVTIHRYQWIAILWADFFYFFISQFKFYVVSYTTKSLNIKTLKEIKI